MSLTKFEDFLASHFGVTDQVYNNLYNDTPNKAVFFQPYASKSDPLIRLASVVTAPAAFLIYALDKAIATIWYALKSMSDLLMCDPAEAINSLNESYNNLLITGMSILCTITSPVINTMALIGGGIATVFNESNEGNQSSSFSGSSSATR